MQSQAGPTLVEPFNFLEHCPLTPSARCALVLGAAVLRDGCGEVKHEEFDLEPPRLKEPRWPLQNCERFARVLAINAEKMGKTP